MSYRNVKERNRRIVALYIQGKKVSHLAEQFQVTKSVVYDAIKQNRKELQ